MENNLPAVQLDDVVAAKKREDWSQYGVVFYKRELQLQAMAQKAVAKLVIPKTIEEIPNAELALKDVKKDLKAIVEARKELTDKLTAVTGRMAQAEKSLEDPLQKFQDSILTLKQEYEKKKQKELLIENERRLIQQNVLDKIIETKAAFANKVTEQVSKAYRWAITNKVQPGKTLDEYIYKCSDKLKIFDFEYDGFGGQISKHLSSEQINLIVGEVVNKNPINSGSYIDDYRKQLKEKFEFYHIDLANAEQALEKEAQEKADAENKIQTEQLHEKLAVKLETTATVLNTGPQIKELKKVFEIDMPDTLECAVLVMSAFVANLAACRQKLRVTNYTKLTVGQMGNALCACKNEDNIFQPAGIIFKEVSKL